MAMFTKDTKTSSDDAIREELLKKSMEISAGAKEVGDIIQTKEDKQKSKFDILREGGIDYESGIGLLGDEKTYESKIKEFTNIAKSKYGKLMDYKASLNMEEYSKESGELKILCNYLGINKLFIMAKSHEYKSSQKDTNYVIENFKEYEDEIMRVINVINDYLR